MSGFTIKLYNEKGKSVDGTITIIIDPKKQKYSPVIIEKKIIANKNTKIKIPKIKKASGKLL